MDMMSVPPESGAEHSNAAPSSVFLYHPAFCQLALPLRAAKGPWLRDVGTASVAIDMGETTTSLPAGKLLRLLLIAILDQAARSGDARVDLRASSAAFAESIGIELSPTQLRGLSEQLDRLVAAKINVSLEGAIASTLLDGRSRSAPDANGWRSNLKLGSKFAARLAEKTIPLDRKIVLALWENPTALDAYAAITFVTCEMPPGEVAMTSWDDLLARFGSKGQDLAAFRAQFEADIETVRARCTHLLLGSGDEGVEISTIGAPAAEPAAPKPMVAAPTPVAPTPVAPATVTPAPVAAAPEPPPPQPLPAPVVIAPAPAPVLTPMPTPPAPAAPAASPEAEPTDRFQRRAGRILALKSYLTGLQQVVWLQRANGRDDPLVEVTPGSRYDPALVTVLALEPVVVQIAGGLYQRDFERVSAWTMANRDLIDSFWFDEIDDIDAILARVKKVPAPGWRD